MHTSERSATRKGGLRAQAGVVFFLTVWMLGPTEAGATGGSQMPSQYSVLSAGGSSYVLVDRCCDLLIHQLAEAGQAYVAGVMNLQRNVATAAPVWPGQNVTGGPGLIGFATGVPVPIEVPGYALASTPGQTDDSTEVPPQEGVGVATASAHSELTTQRADALFASAHPTPEQGGGSEAHLTQELTSDAATSTVTAVATGIDIGGVVKVGTVRVAASAKTGETGVARAVIADCTVGPVPCTIDGDGVHLDDGASPLALRQAQDALSALEESGTRISAGGTVTGKGSSAAMGLIVDKATESNGATTRTIAVYGWATVELAVTGASGTGTSGPAAVGPSGEASGPFIVAPPSPAGGPVAVLSAGSQAGGASAPASALEGSAEPVTSIATPAGFAFGLTGRMSSGAILWLALAVLLFMTTTAVRWIATHASEPAAPAPRQNES